MAAYGAYVRRSTFDQENEHQREAIRDWFDPHDIAISIRATWSISKHRTSRSRSRATTDSIVRRGSVAWPLLYFL